MKKKKELKNMDIKEVSFVDRPANKRKFLVIKREDGEITELTIKTDATADGTILSVNGEDIENLQSFWFGFMSAEDFEPGMMWGSYTVTSADGAEFDRETTFNLKKGMNTMKKITLESLLKSLNVDPTSLSEERTAEIESTLRFVNMIPPEDAAGMLNIIKASLVKEEAPTEGDPPAEDATTEELAPEKITEIRSAMSQLNAMLPEDQRVVIKSEEPSEMVQVLAAIAGLKKDEGDPPATDADAAPDTMAEILKRLVKVEKTTGVSDESNEDADDEPTAIELYTKLTKKEKLDKYGTLYGETQANMDFDLKAYLEGQ